MAGFRRREPAVSNDELRPVPACLIGQVAPRCAQGRIGQSPPPGAGTREALLPQHPRRVQTFNNDAAVGFGQPCGQDVQVMGADVSDPAVQPGNLLVRARYCREPFVQRDRARHSCRSSLNAAASGRGLATCSITTPSAVATVAKRRTPTSTPTREPGSATPGCWGRWTSTRTLASRRVPLRRTEIASTRARPARMRRSIPRVFSWVRTVPITGRVEVPAVGLDPHRAGGEAHPVAVAAFAFEPREPDPFPSALASTRALPVPVGLHRAPDAVGVGLLRAFRPPHLPGLSVDTHVAFYRVPAFPQHPKRRLRGPTLAVCHASISAFRVATVQLYALRRAPKCLANDLA